MAAGGHHGAGREPGQGAGGRCHAAHRGAARVRDRHRLRIQAGSGKDLGRPTLAVNVECHGAAGDRVVGRVDAGQLEHDIVFHHQPALGAPEYVGLVLAQPQHGVQRQEEADRLAGDAVDAARPEVLAPPLRLRFGTAVEPADRGIEPIAPLVDGNDRLPHTDHRQRLDLPRIGYLADHLADIGGRGLPQRIRRILRPVGIVRVAPLGHGRARRRGDPPSGHVVQVGFQIGGADVDAQQVGRVGCHRHAACAARATSAARPVTR